MADPLIEEIKRSLKQPKPWITMEESQQRVQSDMAADEAAESLTPMGTAKRYAEPIIDALKAAALPASLLGGPVGMAAGGALALDGISSAVDDPNATNTGMALLGLLPFAKPAAKFAKGIREAKTIDTMRKTHGAGDMGAAFSREVPYRAGGSTQTATRGPMSAEPETLMQRARAQVDESLNPVDMDSLPSALQELSHPGAQRFMNREFAANNPVFRKMEQAGAFSGRRTNDVPQGMFPKRPVTKHEMPGPEINVLEPTADVQGLPGINDVDELLAGLDAAAGKIPTARRVTRANRLQRQTEDAVNAFQDRKAHGIGGFTDLPTLSGPELDRISANIERIIKKRGSEF